MRTRSQGPVVTFRINYTHLIPLLEQFLCQQTGQPGLATAAGPQDAQVAIHQGKRVQMHRSPIRSMAQQQAAIGARLVGRDVPSHEVLDEGPQTRSIGLG